MYTKLIEKRDGRIVNFDRNKIYNVIVKAFADFDILDNNLLNTTTDDIINELELEQKSTQKVEHIQDIVEKHLAKFDYKIAKKYTQVREIRTKERNKKHRNYPKFTSIIKVTDRENANVGNSPSAKLLQIAEISSRDYAVDVLTKKEILEKMDDNLIYPHDYSWYSVGTLTCCFIPLAKLLQTGFNSGHGYIRSPKRISSASSLACIILQANQNEQHGGQAFGFFDRDMATYVNKEYLYQLDKMQKQLEKFNVSSYDINKVMEEAWENTRKETFQAMEALIFNLNTMHSRAGSQVPFTSINIGTDTTREGRLVTEMILLAYENGLGKGEQALFPNIIFKVKKGINFEPGTINHDLLRLSLRVTSKRLFPNYVFQDCSLNKDFPTDVPVMGCRTRVSWNIFKPKDEQSVEGRGNASFTTINLPRIALDVTHKPLENNEAFNDIKTQYKINILKQFNNHSVKDFFITLNELIEITTSQLVDRLEYQSKFNTNDFPFLMNGVWLDSEKLKRGEFVKDIVKYGTLSIGFIGLAETLKCLVNNSHASSKEADILGEEIIKFLRNKVDESQKKYQYNFSLLATPAEGLSEKLVKIDKQKYGIIEGVTDKDWYTNSFHVPVEIKISLFDKIDIEGKYHKYCNAGQISYIELSEAPIDNIDGMYDILCYMERNDMGYVAINFPIDRCRECGEFGYIETICPTCGGNNISRIRRITGYLAELTNFNNGKLQECINRQYHNKKNL